MRRSIENRPIKNSLPNSFSYCSELDMVKELVYDECGFELKNLKIHPEGKAYGACSFELNGLTIDHRLAKITPKKTGQFVAIWKRNKSGETEPYDINDDLDYLIITVKSGHNLGQFIFPKSVLAEKQIITKNGIEGKLGIRVYPPWDSVTNNQAEKTQSWQTKFFVNISDKESIDFDLAKKLITITNKQF
ncbi:MAG: MepB family protein [Cyclobacteriaceae bacterium]